MSSPTRLRPYRPLCFALLAAFLVPAPGTSQSDSSSSFGETVDVELVNVEVWVSDAKGNAITGLSVDDFEVREDGQPVAIAYFDEIRGLGVPELTPARLRELPEESPKAASPTQVEESATTGYLVLYFDELFSTPAGRKQLIKDLRAFLEARLVAAERVLILRQDTDLTVEATLGSTRQELEKALDRLRKPSTRGAQTWADEKTALRFIQSEWERISVLGGTAPGGDPCDFFVGEAFREAQRHVRLMQDRLGETLTHLSDTASFLAGLPGPKTLVYISDALTMRPGANLLSYVKAVCPGRQGDRRLDLQDSLNTAFRALTRHASANRVTMYTIQALGLRQGTSLSSVDQRGVRNTSRTTTRYDNETRTQEREGLTFLARETGGRSIFNSNRFQDDFEDIAAEMSGYYSLAYAPPHGGDGLEHRIDVKVRGLKAQVRHRAGYRDKSADQRMAERLESTLHLHLMANPLKVRLGAGQVREGKGQKYTVPLHVIIPVEQLTFLPREGADVARLKVQVMAQNERRRRSAFLQKRYELEKPPADATSQLVSLALELELPQGVHVVAFGVRDEASQESSFVSTGLDIGASESSALN